jgi:hypothetical protein
MASPATKAFQPLVMQLLATSTGTFSMIGVTMSI